MATQPMHKDATRFWVVRHGQIEANISAHWHGSTDSPLTDEGHRQVARVAARFKSAHAEVRAVYSSPLSRTHATASGIAGALGLDVRPLAGLREYCLGDWEGTPFKVLSEERNLFRQMSNRQWAPPNGESLQGVLDRMLDAFHGVATDHPGEEVLMVGHGAATAVMLAHLLEQDALGWHSYHINNCSVSEFWLHPEPRLGLFNDVEHLDN